MRGGTTLLIFGDGKARRIPNEKKAAVMKAFPDAHEPPKTAFGMPMSGMQAARDAMNFAPAVLGGAAALAAPEIGVPMWIARTLAAGVGAAPGVAAKLAANNEPVTAGSVLRGSGEQALGQLGGEGMAAGVGLVGRGLLRSSIGSRGKEAAAAVSEMVRKRLPVGGARILPPGIASRLGTAGSMLGNGAEMAKANRQALTGARNAANAAAGAEGIRIDRGVAENAIRDLLDSARHEMADDSEIKFLRAKLASWQRRKAEWIEPTEIQGVISRFDATSKPIFKAIERGDVPVPAGLQAKAVYRKSVADALRQAMRDNVPGLRPANAALSKGIAAEKGIVKGEADAGARSLTAHASRFTVGGLAGGLGAEATGRSPEERNRIAVLAGLAALRPELTSRAGLALTDPHLLMLLRQATAATAPDALRNQ